MGLIKDFKAEYKKAMERQELGKNERRPLVEQDRLDWYDAGSERATNTKPSTIQDVQALVRQRNPLRWRRLKSDFKWMQKEMKKMGLNPEDARYML